MAGAGSSEQRSHSSSFTSGPPTFLPEGRADVLFTWSHTNHMRFSCRAMQQQCCQRQERCPQRTEMLAWPEKDMPSRSVVPVQKMKAVQSFVPLPTQREYTYVFRAKNHLSTPQGSMWLYKKSCLSSLQNGTAISKLAFGWFLKGFYVKT